MSQLKRDALMSLAKLCYKNDFCNDVIRYMIKITKIETPLKLEIRGMFFDSYNKLIVPYFTLLISRENSSEKTPGGNKT